MTDHDIVAEMQEIRALLKEFGATLYGFDPGVLAGFDQGTLEFDNTEWAWLKPILLELRHYRKKDIRKIRKRRKAVAQQLARTTPGQ